MVEEPVLQKQTTILAADVEGYTRLLRTDEEAVHRTLGEYRETIEALVARHEGRIFGSGGDFALAEFGSAVEAVRCAISWQKEMASRNAGLANNRKLTFRVGIHVGAVMLRDGDLSGEGINVAARLQSLAHPGGVCVSKSVFEQAEHELSLKFEDLGPQSVKDSRELVSAYRQVLDPVLPATTQTQSAARSWQTPVQTTGLTGGKIRSAMIAVGTITTIILTSLIGFSDLNLPLYALVLIVGCANVLTAVIGSFVFGERENLGLPSEGVLEMIARRAIMVGCATGGLLLVFYLLGPELYDKTPSITLAVLLGVMTSSLNAIAVAIACEEIH
jgi:class 3 adenylate cyclase